MCGASCDQNRIENTLNTTKNSTYFGLLAKNLRKSNPKSGHPNASNPNFGVINKKKHWEADTAALATGATLPHD